MTVPAAVLRDEVFRVLRHGRPKTRGQLRALTRQSRSTVNQSLDALVESGLIGAVGATKSTGGRPAMLFSLTGGNGSVLAIHATASSFRVVLCDLKGQALGERVVDWPTDASLEATLTRVIGSAVRLAAANPAGPRHLVAAGVAISTADLAYSNQHHATSPRPSTTWTDLGDFLSTRLSVPVVVDGEVPLMAIGERETSWPDTDDLLFVNLDRTIGSALILGGRLQRGADDCAGDIGHIRVARGPRIRCYCGNVGCLQTVASIGVLRRSLAEADGLDRDLPELVRRGHPVAVQRVVQAGQDVGEVLAACVSLTNPAVVVLGGALALTPTGGPLVKGVLGTLRPRSSPAATDRLQVEVSRAGPDAVLTGAARVSIDLALSIETAVAGPPTRLSRATSRSRHSPADASVNG